MRNVCLERNTNETKISLFLELDGNGTSEIDTGCGFLDHMLTLFSHHGRFDIKLSCIGDIGVDAHHTVEDCAIVLGSAFKKSLGDMKGIKRYGSVLLPMDEALVAVAVDISGRCTYASDFKISSPKLGNFDTELVDEFFVSFARSMGITLHFMQLRGENSHHIIEAAFKGFGRTLSAAVQIDEKYKNEIPSTKGSL